MSKPEEQISDPQTSENKQESGDVGRVTEEGSDVLLGAEVALRKSVANGFSGNVVSAFVVNGISAVLIFMFHLISLESLLSIALSVSMTIYTYKRTDESETFNGSVMNWVLLSFAVITPMSASIGMAFSRREQALNHLSVIKSTLLAIYTAFASWDWSSSSKAQLTGRAASQVDFKQQSDIALDAIVKICSDLIRMLTLPNCSRARHRVLNAGKAEAKDIETLMCKLHRCALKRMLIISDVCEVLKHEGMPGNEAARIRQWERFIIERIELLGVIKRYRTPQALRSFARIFSVFLPPFYAPFYGQMARDLNSLGMAIAFSVLTSIALTSLFESITQIEDPFVGITALDGINVAEELQGCFLEQLLDARRHHYPQAKEVDLRPKTVSLPAGPEMRLLQAA